MKRNETLFLTILTTATLFAGCAGGTTETTSTKPADNSGSSTQQSQAPKLTITNIPIDENGNEIEVSDGNSPQTMEFVLDSSGKVSQKK